MTTRQLSFKGPPQLAIAVGATTPNPSIFGVQVWSTTANSLIAWNGTSWQLSNTPITVSSVAPSSPVLNQLWVQIA